MKGEGIAARIIRGLEPKIPAYHHTPRPLRSLFWWYEAEREALGLPKGGETSLEKLCPPQPNQPLS